MEVIPGSKQWEKNNRCLFAFRSLRNVEMTRIHFLSRALNSRLYSSKYLEIDKKASSRWLIKEIKLFLVFTIPTIFSFTGKSSFKEDVFLQKMNIQSLEPVNDDPAITISSVIKNDTLTVTGRVYDREYRENLPGVKIRSNIEEVGISTDFNGEFTLMVDRNLIIDSLELVIYHRGYKPHKVSVSKYETDITYEIGLDHDAIELVEYVFYRRPLHKKIWRSITWPYRKIEKVFRKK